MKALSIDIETTGLSKDNAEILEVGLVAFDTKVPFTGITKWNALRILLVKNKWEGELYALNLNKNIIKEMLEAQKVFKKSNNPLFKELFDNSMTTLYVNVDYLDETYKSRGFSVLRKIEEFLKDNKFEGPITVAGKNFAGFDGPFLERNSLFGPEFLSKFRHKILDPGSMYILPEDNQVPGLPICLERAGLSSEVPHTAVEDAVLVIKALQAKMLNNV